MISHLIHINGLNNLRLYAFPPFQGKWCSWILLILCACGDPIIVPESDDSPPAIRLVISGVGTDAITLTEDSEPLEINGSLELNRRILMTAVATDRNGGISNVTLSGEAVLNCVDTESDLGLRQFQSYLADNPDDAGIGEEARTVRSTAIDLSIRSFTRLCESRPGFVLTSVSGTFQATAENFHGGTARSAVFNFSYR